MMRVYGDAVLGVRRKKRALKAHWERCLYRELLPNQFHSNRASASLQPCIMNSAVFAQVTMALAAHFEQEERFTAHKPTEQLTISLRGT